MVSIECNLLSLLSVKLYKCGLYQSMCSFITSEGNCCCQGGGLANRRSRAYRPFNNNVDMLLSFFDHLPTSTWTFLTLNVVINGHISTTYPLCSRSYRTIPLADRTERWRRRRRLSAMGERYFMISIFQWIKYYILQQASLQQLAVRLLLCYTTSTTESSTRSWILTKISLEYRKSHCRG